MTKDSTPQASGRTAAAPSSLLLIICPDVVRRERAEQEQLKRLMKGGITADTLIRIRADQFSANADRILLDIGNLSLFAARKALLLRDVDTLNAAATDTLLDFINDLPAHVSLVLSCAKLPAASRVRKRCEKIGTVNDIPELTGDALTRWVGEEAALHGAPKLSSDVIQALIQIGDLTPDGIAPLVAQLALYAGDQTVSLSDVESLFGSRTSLNEFQLVDLLAQKKKGEALLLLLKLLRSGTNAFPLLGLMHRSYLQAYNLRTLLDAGVPQAALPERTGSPFWLIKKQLPLAQSLRRETFHRALDAFVSADSKLKDRSLGNEAVMEELLMHIV